MRFFRNAVLVALATMAALFAVPGPSNAADPGTPGAIAFVRGGNIFLAQPNAAPVQATTGGGYDWPKLQPHSWWSGRDVAYLYHSNLYIGAFDTSGHLYIEQQLTTGGHTGPASWSPDGTQITYIQTLTYQTLYISRLESASPFGVHANATVGSTTSHRVGPAVAAPAFTGAPWSPLQTSTGVAWSPDGQWIAFPGGDCLGVVDNCLSTLNVATNVENTITVFSGGGDTNIGYATDPAWTADSAHLMWNQQISAGDGEQPVTPLQVWESDPYGAGRHQIAGSGDGEPAPSPAADGSLLVTASHNGVAWVTKVTAGNARTYLYQGYEEDWGVA